jgi:flagellar protein FliO/FliZ
MLDQLLGAQLGTAAKFAIAFLLVLGLIGITAIILKRFGGGRMPTSGGGRNRQPRLAVLDSAVVDAKRRLVLIRRDNSEHLLLIGGPSDVVVETNINRAGAPAVQQERRPRGLQQQELESPESSLVPEPAYEEPAPRAPQPAPRMREATQRSRPQPQPEPIDEFPQAPASRQEPRHEPQPEPAAYSPPPPLPPRPIAHPSAAAPVSPPRAPQAPAPSRNDPQYADMAQKLEAALRKPASAPAPKAPEPRVAPPAPQQRTSAPPMPQTRPMPAAPALAQSQPSPAPAKQPAPNPFDSLEAEMASLLGQDKKR